MKPSNKKLKPPKTQSENSVHNQHELHNIEPRVEELELVRPQTHHHLHEEDEAEYVLECVPRCAVGEGYLLMLLGRAVLALK